MADHAPDLRNPAASMSLLQTILDSALDPGYRKDSVEGRGKLPVWKQLVLGVVVAALACGSVIAVKNLRFSADEKAQAKAQLVDQITQRQKTVDSLTQAIERMDTQVSAVVRELTAGVGTLSPGLSVGSAVAPMAGPGVTVTLEDPVQVGVSQTGVVRDTDLRSVVNLLWQAGAEGVSVSGVRIGPMTTIRAAGSVVLVDLQAVESPYIIQAVGDGDRLNGAVQQGSAALAAHFSLSVHREGQISLQGAPVSQARLARDAG